MDQLFCPRCIHRLYDVLCAVIVHGEEEIMPLGADLNGRKHLGREIINHVIGANAKLADRFRVRHIRMNEGRIAIMRKIAFDDIGDDHLMAIGKQLGREITPDKTVTAENNMPHLEPRTLNGRNENGANNL
ncbi:Uncharacterised protein [Brucella abortus]|nr:Uncharacterised protein [Brucella abortus]